MIIKVQLRCLKTRLIARDLNILIDVRYHFIRAEISSGKVLAEYCPTAVMVADIMTKPATKAKLVKFKDFLFGM